MATHKQKAAREVRESMVASYLDMLLSGDVTPTQMQVIVRENRHRSEAAREALTRFRNDYKEVDASGVFNDAD